MDSTIRRIAAAVVVAVLVSLTAGAALWMALESLRAAVLFSRG